MTPLDGLRRPFTPVATGRKAGQAAPVRGRETEVAAEAGQTRGRPVAQAAKG